MTLTFARRFWGPLAIAAIITLSPTAAHAERGNGCRDPGGHHERGRYEDRRDSRNDRRDNRRDRRDDRQRVYGDHNQRSRVYVTPRDHNGPAPVYRDHRRNVYITPRPATPCHGGYGYSYAPPPRVYSGWNPRRHNGYYDRNIWYWGAPPQAFDRDCRPGYRAIGRGHRLPQGYHVVVVDDWRSHRLYAPRRDQYWARDDRGEYFLVGLATGVILDNIVRDY